MLNSVPCGLPACQQLLRDARQQVGFYKALHQRAVLREAKLKQQLAQCQSDCDARLQQRDGQRQQRLDELEAEVRLLKQRLYGRSCEAPHVPNTLAHPPDDASPGPAGGAAAPTGPPPPPRRRRGQQPGGPGHPRRSYDHLPATDAVADLPLDQRHGTSCGLPLTPCGSEPAVRILEVEVRAHRRLIRRRRYRPTCACGTHPTLVTAPPPPRLIPNSALGVSVWVEVLLDK